MMLYGLINSSTFITNVDGYANQMNMDGAEPSGFYWSEWRNGVSYEHPNDALRGWYFEDDDESEA